VGIIYELSKMDSKEDLNEYFSISELFTPKFMKRYTDFASLEEMKQCARAELTKNVITSRPLYP